MKSNWHLFKCAYVMTISVSAMAVAGRAQADNPTFYRAIIQQSDNGHCLTANDDTRVFVAGCADLWQSKGKKGDTQRWFLTDRGFLKTEESDKCLQPRKGKVQPGSELRLGSCKSRYARWLVDEGRLIHKASKLCIEGRGTHVFEDNNVELFRCNKKDTSQEWLVYGQKIGAFKDPNIRCKVPGKTPLNDAFFTRAHNAYETKHFRSFSSAIHRWDVVEIDLTPHSKGVWVSHGENKNHNNCGGPQSDGSFYACLKDLRKWHDARPNHKPKLVVLNLKLTNGVLPAEYTSSHFQLIQGFIGKVIGKANLYRPADRRGNHKHLRRALYTSKWPTIDELRGKFIFLMNAGPALPVAAPANKTIAQYVKKFGYKAHIFACPFVRDSDDLVNNRKWKYLEKRANHIACITLQFDERKKLNGVFKRKKSRRLAQKMLMDVWNPVGIEQSFIRSPCTVKGSACNDDPRGFNTLVRTGATLIGTNFPQSMRWARNGRRGMTRCNWTRKRPKRGLYAEGKYGFGVFRFLKNKMKQLSENKRQRKLRQDRKVKRKKKKHTSKRRKKKRKIRKIFKRKSR